ncbi:hypothetical protein E4U31_000626 [Claviceps sp. LM219 group G6]|nr:hypothetical protein E4U31_000626 [Claviceps sp. LM219 group G6]
MSTSSRAMRPTKESLPKHLKEFCANISTEWEACQDDIDQRTSTTTDVNNYVVNMYNYYVEEEKTGIQLIRMFSEDFADWPVQTWNRADIKIRRALRDHLEAHGFVSKRPYSSVSHQLRRLVFEYFNEDALAEDPLSGEEQSADASEGSSDPSANSSAENTFDDNQADAIDEDASNASVECSAENAEKDSANFGDENSADFDDNDRVKDSDNLDGKEPARDLRGNDTTSLTSTETHNKESNLPEGFAHAKERPVGLVLVELNKEEKKFLSRVLALKGLAREKAAAQWTTLWCVKLTTMPWINFLRDLDSYYRLVARLVP